MLARAAVARVDDSVTAGRFGFLRPNIVLAATERSPAILDGLSLLFLQALQPFSYPAAGCRWLALQLAGRR